MPTTIYIKLSEEESELVRGVAGRKHNRWARGVLLREAARSIPLAEVEAALAQSGLSQERQAMILARLGKSENS